jgi:hypothetical protein
VDTGNLELALVVALGATLPAAGIGVHETK